MLLRQLIRGVLREAAMADGGSEGASGQPARGQPQAGDRSTPRAFAERFKASFLSTPQRDPADAEGARQESQGPDQREVPAAKQTKEPAKAPKLQQQAAPEHGAEDDDAQAEGADFSTVAELAERTGLALDRILDLSVSGKVGDKETKASIREMLRSYQTGELLNTKLQTHASEVAAWKTQQQQEQQAFQQNLQRMDAGLQVAQRLLQGEFSQIDWQQLQQTDPAQYAQTYLGFQQRQAQLEQIAQQLGEERQSQQSQQAEQHKAWLNEQKQLLEAKLPEWSDAAVRKAAITEIAEVVGKVYGFDAEHLGKLTDHRDFLVLNDALKWQKLQASKAGVMNKVREAPKILRPGAAQSQGARKGEEVTAAKGQLKKSGKVKDFAKAFRALGGS